MGTIKPRRGTLNAERVFYAEDREHLLALFFQRHGYRPRPADALEGILNLLDYMVIERELPGDDWAKIEERTVIVCSQLAEKISHQRADLAGVRSSCLAHELGHIRLHPEDCDLPYEERERQADLYAAVFLVPWRELQACPEHLRLVTAREGGAVLEARDLWREVYSIARRFGVTATLIRRFLVELGVCEYDRETRLLSLAKLRV